MGQEKTWQQALADLLSAGAALLVEARLQLADERARAQERTERERERGRGGLR